MNKHDLRSLVGQGHTQEAVTQLYNWLSDDIAPLADKLLLLRSENTRDAMQLGVGLLGNQEYNRDEENIDQQFLQLLHELEIRITAMFPPIGKADKMADFEEHLRFRTKAAGFTLLEKLKAGKNVIVYLATDSANKKMIIKALDVPNAKREEMQREVNLLQGRTKHENVIQVSDSDIHEYPFFIVAEYATGTPLSESLTIARHFPLYMTLEILIGICKACQFLRKRRIWAANLEPDTILLTDDAVPLVSPFTLFRSAQPTFSVHHFAHYAAYQSPERLREEPEKIAPELAEQADMFSIAVIGYELLTGEALFGGETIHEVIGKRWNFFTASPRGRYKLLCKIERHSILRDWFTRMLAPDAKDRPENLQIVIDALEKLKPVLSRSQQVARDSYQRCLANPKGDYALEFYQSLYEKYPGIEGHFPDPDRQRKKLKTAIKLFLESGTDASFIENLPYMRGHTNLSAQHFKTFVHLLIRKICDFDDYWKTHPEIEAAWCDLEHLFGNVIERVMLEKQADAGEAKTT